MADQYTEKLKEAQKLRDLGFYNRALESYWEVEQEKSDLALATEIGRTMFEQGCLRLSFEKVNAAIEMFSETTEDKVEVASAQMLKAFVTAFMTVQFSSSLEVATHLYNDHLLHRPVEDYDKRMVAMQVGYQNSRASASTFGVTVEGPSPDPEFVKQLFNHLIRNSRFSEALRIVKIQSTSTEPSQKKEFIATLLQEKLLPDLARAEALCEHAQLLQEADLVERSDVQLSEAKRLYEKAGHAYGALMIEVQNWGRWMSKSSKKQVMERLYQIKEHLETIGYWDGVRDTIAALYGIAQEASDIEAQIALDRESLRLRDIHGWSLSWVLQQLKTFGTWNFSGANSAKMLSSLEAFYDTLSTMEAPRLRAITAYMISERYKTLGDASKSAVWAMLSANSENLPDRSRFLYRPDLEHMTNPIDKDTELEVLRTELARVAEDISAETTPYGERHLGIMRISHMSMLYMNQIELRGFERAKQLVEICLEVAESRLEYLPAAQSKKWRGSLIQNRAQFEFFGAYTGQTPDADKLRTSLALYEQAVTIYEDAGLVSQIGVAQGQMAFCHQQLWQLEGAVADSIEFEAAISCYESAAACLARVPTPLYERKLHAVKLLVLWFQGYSKGVTLYKKTTSPLEETLKWLDVTEKLADEERHDLSALKTKQAILAKQGLRREDNIRAMYDTAVMLHVMAGDVQGLWNWLQKAKARSVSDMLGLGINLPEYLKKRVDGDPKARTMLEHEVELLQRINQDISDTQFYLRKELDAHRRAMHGVETLDGILALREGRAVSQARLRSLRHHTMAEGAGRRIFYVDWFTCGDKIIALVVSDESDDVDYFDTQMTIMEIAEWKKTHLTINQPLNDENPSPLRAIRRLVEPLLNMTKEDDLLVFCPTDALHGIPMHAAIISPEESNKPRFLIDRNPIVYTSSMTTYEQCVLQAASTSNKANRHTETFLAVYEQPEGLGWQRERDKIYKTSNKLASQVNGVVAVGSEVTRSKFEAACQSDVVHFFGHFKHEAENIMDQGLILVSDNGRLPQNSSTVNPAEGTDNDDPPCDTFSVSDMFSTSIKASHFTLIACASATQAIQQGDEPLGIVTALLCAGASSVVGTMWPIASGAGRAFLKRFSNTLQANAEGESIVDLAVALQKTVKKLKTGPKAMKEPYHWSAFVLHGAWFYRLRSTKGKENS